MINWKKHYLWLFILLMACVFIAACSKRDSPPRVKIKQKVAVNNQLEETLDTDKTLKVAILLNASVKETYRTHYNFIQFLEEQLDRKIDIIQKNTYGEILDLFIAGKADIGFVCGYLSVLGDEKGVMEKIAMPVVNGNKQYSSYVITRNEEEITTIHDLKDKKFAFSNPYSFAGYLVPKHLIEKEGYEFDHYFWKTYFTYSHDHSVSSVVNGLVDGAAIYSTTYEKLLKENDPVLNEIKVIAKSALVGNHPIVVHPHLNADLKAEIQDILLQMHKSEQGKRVLAQMNYDLFIHIDEDLYKPVQSMLQEMEEIK